MKRGLDSRIQNILNHKSKIDKVFGRQKFLPEPFGNSPAGDQLMRGWAEGRSHLMMSELSLTLLQDA